MEKKFEPSEYNQRIRLYINKQMSAEELKSFENEMNINKDLANEVKAQQFQIAFNYLKLKTEINEVRAGLERKVIIPQEGKIEKPFYFLILKNNYFRAVAAILLISLTGYFFYPKANEDNNVVVNTPLILPPTTQELINSSIADTKQPLDGTPKELNDLIIGYERADKIEEYKKVAQGLAPKKATSPPADYDPDEYGGVSTGTPDPTVVEEDAKTASYRAYYHGLSLLALAKYDAALRRFDAVQTKELTDRVQWYKALAYLKKGDKVKSEEALKNIVQGSSEYKAQAQKLIDSMK